MIRKLDEFFADTGRTNRSMVATAVQWAEMIMQKIDNLTADSEKVKS